jgi:glycosyltransferase involved in cell wall biosynthesis
MFGQSLDFRSRIELILVDDGSTDRSAKIIRRWQRSHPGNIKYIHKANGGVGSARNLGLKHATHDWVTFIDPDDFVDPAYFAVVADALRRHAQSSVSLVSCNFIRYFEKTRTFSDTHPLRYRFLAGERLVPADAPGRDIQLGVNSAFFSRKVIAEQGLAFDERIRPNFEDAHFVARYLLRVPDTRVLFLPAARYLYRVREDRSSLLQTGEADSTLYSDQIRHGYVGLLEDAESSRGRAPRFVQDVVFYSLLWHINRIVDGDAALALLNSDQRRAFEELLAATFAHIDAETVLEYDITPLAFSHRLGILARFKNLDPPLQRVEVTRYDAAKHLIRAVCWSRSAESTAAFRVDGKPVEPRWTKTRPRMFNAAPFIWEHIAWVPLLPGGSLAANVDGRDARLFARGTDLSFAAELARIRAALAVLPPPQASLPQYARELRQAARSAKALADFKDAWLFMDRDDAADDSAEQLYRFVRQVAPEINARFILSRKSPDWRRLEEDGFRLLGFHEPEHAIALLNASHLISSQADHYVLSYLGQAEFGDMLNYALVFLQHGIIKDDISGWLNQIPLDLLVTSTRDEYDSIVGDGSPYRFTGKEVVLTGLPRHDALLAGPRTVSPTMVVMPTWRASLTGAAAGPGNQRSVDRAFFSSDFARRWKSFLHSQRLAALVERSGWRIVFLPHPNLEQYLGFFDLPSSIEVRRFGDGRSIQPLFRELSVFVTDYSSKALDVAMLEKPVLYYQFDPEAFFGGGHTSRPGYFDYARDGFGPVCTDEDALIEALDAAMRLNGVAAPQYRERAGRTFPFRDGKCSERVFAAIRALAAPL